MREKFLLALLLLAPMLLASEKGTTEVSEFILDNGMKVIVKEDHRAPVVISQVWYKVGSADEYGGITGVSHVLEHMMFKGTKKIPAERFSEIIAENGGQENAFTSRDYTGYYQMLGKDRLEISFELEADRMVNLTLPEEEFVKEVEVVKEERRLRTEDKPNALTYEELNAVAYTNAPYHQPVIGWMQDLDSMKVEDLRDWYHKWYAPNNATLVVVGDVQPDEVLMLAKKHFGPLKPTDIPARKPRNERPQQGERRLQVRAPAELPYLLLGYKAPVLGQADAEWEPYALTVLSGILDGGNSSRLNKNLIRGQEIAASAGASYNLYARHRGLFLMDATPASGHTVKEMEEALYAEVDKLKNELVTEQELKRVKAQVVAQEIYKRDSISHQANEIGALETIGVGWQIQDEYAECIEAVTAEQVRQVARKYLIERTRTVATLKPEAIQREVTAQPDTEEAL